MFEGCKTQRDIQSEASKKREIEQALSQYIDSNLIEKSKQTVTGGKMKYVIIESDQGVFSAHKKNLWFRFFGPDKDKTYICHSSTADKCEAVLKSEVGNMVIKKPKYKTVREVKI